MIIGISACLAGEKVRYDGADKKDLKLLKILKGHELVKICPELAAGFPVPRESLETRNGKVYSLSGEDLSEKLNMGAHKCLELVKDCDFVILKDKSPSCGLRQIYDGTFSGKLVDGNGIFAGLCLNRGIPVYSENDIEEIKRKTAGK